MAELVRWLIVLLYPHEQSSVTHAKAVRAHLNRARREGELTEKQKKNGEKLLEVSSFLRWISKKSVRGFSWGERLEDKHPELYLSVAVVDVCGVSAEAEVGYAVAEGLPATLKESNELLLKELIKNRELARRLNAFEEKEKKANAYKQQQRKYGKSGGRGNAK